MSYRKRKINEQENEQQKLIESTLGDWNEFDLELRKAEKELKKIIERKEKPMSSREMFSLSEREKHLRWEIGQLEESKRQLEKKLAEENEKMNTIKRSK